MRFVPASCVREGMTLGRDLWGRNGELLLSEGSVICYAYIEKIKALGYNGVYINDDLSWDCEISETISEELRCKAVKTVRDAFTGLTDGKSMPSEYIENITRLVEGIITEIISTPNIMVNMIDLKAFDDYTFYHSVNVTVLSIIIGVSLGLEQTQLYRLGLAAMLHDMGKVFIPKELLNKRGRLTDEEFEQMKSHSTMGYRYMKEGFQIPSAAYMGILQHHEKYDGSGYPMGLKGDRISLFGRIIAVADVYDALTSDRPYRRALLPSEAVEYIMGGGGTLFDPVIAKDFTHRIAPYPVGTCVRLSSSEIGLVVENYKDCCMRPRVKVIRYENKEVEPYYIDLKNDKSTRGITIVGVLEEACVLTAV